MQTLFDVPMIPLAVYVLQTAQLLFLILIWKEKRFVRKSRYPVAMSLGNSIIPNR